MFNARRRRSVTDTLIRYARQAPTSVVSKIGKENTSVYLIAELSVKSYILSRNKLSNLKLEKFYFNISQYTSYSR